jgi:hypothetical protein
MEHPMTSTRNPRTFEKNRPLVAVPNVLSSQTTPNTLGGVHAAPVRAMRLGPSVRTIAVATFVLAVLAALLVRRI